MGPANGAMSVLPPARLREAVKMSDLAPPEPCLDDLCAATLAGDARAEAALFATLRERFLSVAKRRVSEDDLEDLVQDALQIVHRKHGQRPPGPGILVWGLAVLRNVIGNYYQARERASRQVPFEDRAEDLASIRHGGEAGPDTVLDFSEASAQIQTAITRLARHDRRCGRIFRRILESLAEAEGTRDISQRAIEKVRRDYPDMSRGSVYVALHRCRSRLRDIIQDMEEGPRR